MEKISVKYDEVMTCSSQRFEGTYFIKYINDVTEIIQF